MRRLIPSGVEIAIFAALAIVCAGVVGSFNHSTTDLGFAALAGPIFLVAACMGLHASWVAIIAVVRETSVRNESGPAAFLMSDYDGFIGWMVLGWTMVIGYALYWWYGRKGIKGTFPVS